MMLSIRCLFLCFFVFAGMGCSNTSVFSFVAVQKKDIEKALKRPRGTEQFKAIIELLPKALPHERITMLTYIARACLHLRPDTENNSEKWLHPEKARCASLLDSLRKNLEMLSLVKRPDDALAVYAIAAQGFYLGKVEPVAGLDPEVLAIVEHSCGFHSINKSVAFENAWQEAMREACINIVAGNQKNVERYTAQALKWEATMCHNRVTCEYDTPVEQHGYHAAWRYLELQLTKVNIDLQGTDRRLLAIDNPPYRIPFSFNIGL